MPAGKARARQRGAGPEADFGGDDHLIPVRLERGAEHRFGFPAGVAVGGIEEVDPGLQRAADQIAGQVRAHLIYGTDVPVAGGERHGPESQARDREAGIAEQRVLHDETPGGDRRQCWAHTIMCGAAHGNPSE